MSYSVCGSKNISESRRINERMNAQAYRVSPIARDDFSASRPFEIVLSPLPEASRDGFVSMNICNELANARESAYAINSHECDGTSEFATLPRIQQHATAGRSDDVSATKLF